MSFINGVLHCDWADTCPNDVSHIGAKGYVYCKGHVQNRHGVERTRKLLVRELEQLKRREPIKF